MDNMDIDVPEIPEIESADTSCISCEEPFRIWPLDENDQFRPRSRIHLTCCGKFIHQACLKVWKEKCPRRYELNNMNPPHIACPHCRQESPIEPEPVTFHQRYRATGYIGHYCSPCQRCVAFMTEPMETVKLLSTQHKEKVNELVEFAQDLGEQIEHLWADTSVQEVAELKATIANQKEEIVRQQKLIEEVAALRATVVRQKTAIARQHKEIEQMKRTAEIMSQKQRARLQEEDENKRKRHKSLENGMYGISYSSDPDNYY